MKYFLGEVEINRDEAIDILKCCFAEGELYKMESNVSIERPQSLKLKYNTLKIYEERNNTNR